MTVVGVSGRVSFVVCKLTVCQLSGVIQLSVVGCQFSGFSWLGVSCRGARDPSHIEMCIKEETAAATYTKNL